MKNIILITSIILLAGTAARSADMFEKKSSFSFREMLKNFTAFLSPTPQKLSPSGLPLNLAPAKARAWLEEASPVLLDIRTPDEYAQERLKGAALLDFYAPDFVEKLGLLDKSAKYLIYCRSGNRSGKALETMGQLGFTEAHHIEGGITAWTAAGYPTVK